MPRYGHRTQPIYDNEILAVVKSAGGFGKHDSNGDYGSFKLHGFESYDAAHAHQKGVYRSALYMSGTKSKPKNILPGGYRLSVQVKKVHNDDGTYSLNVQVTDKEHAIRKLTEKYGDDIEQWPYSPYKYLGHKNYG
jgi:hypothetical protein